jgi:hypothetical protein
VPVTPPQNRLGIRRVLGDAVAMKKHLVWLFLVVFGATLWTGCSDSSDMSTPPATNAPASTNK